MIKIVELINSLDKRGGAEVFFSNLCVELQKRDDVELIVVSLFDNIDSSFDFLSNGNIKFFKCHKKGKIGYKSSRLLRKIIKEFNPDIINTHLGTISSYYLAFGFKKRKWKVVHTVHSLAQKEARKYDVIIRKPYIRKKILSFIGISDQISDSIKELHPNSDAKTVFNGIPFAKKELVNKDITFLCPARYSDEKNHKMLFNVFDKYCDIYKNATLVCCGNGDTVNEYREYVSNLKNGKNIVLNGQVNNVQDFLNRSKYFVLSSKYEGNPISVLEALNSGVPCVVPNVGGIPDIIKDGYNGFLFSACDNEDMLKKMIEATECKKYDQLSGQCVESVKEFSIEKTADNYLELFYSLRGIK